MRACDVRVTRVCRHVKVGDTVSQFDALCEVQSDKASVTITSRFDGTIACIHHAVDATARVGQPLCDIDVKDAEGAVETAQPAKQASTPSQQQKPAHATEQTVTSSGKVLATPAVRRIAMENAVRRARARLCTPCGVDCRFAWSTSPPPAKMVVY
jgi:2-oxoisovalerate dehydrogenase E2 component (dihydrolipoyl transacylase)